ncbi:carbohydrate ABC transporter permease [Paenibacillus qinlingensis]|uniref:Multiple sugar transport system permease protein/putative aldouronate transport system permease protein n=1 Tax=Paenibacillus qinlingensis TaxID=1837343 RepID=A0ABU1NV06_9BACL|nr:carbohydrate ABC transporter permease [Paenibacillus qinlingensis]MDR6550832.1 multiple sugar transport system permease protein/putative aldouronate transport system permease protein [Paenibacillus qinlingensis]
MRTTSMSRKIFLACNGLLMAAIALLAFLPLLNVWAQSLSSAKAIEGGHVFFWPVQFTLISYDYVIHNHTIWRAFAITICLAVFGTAFNLLATSSLAYPLSRKEYRGATVILLLVLLTMIFQAPLIPNYLWLKQLGLLNTLWVLVLPGAISAFNFFVTRSFFQEIPSELIDSARIDGCGEQRILWNIVLPLSKPVLATMGLFYAVGHWNSYMSAIFYINNRALYPLQVKVQEIIANANIMTDASLLIDMNNITPDGIKMAVVVVSSLPIIVVYPFLQKYFVKGLMIGSIKS